MLEPQFYVRVVLNVILGVIFAYSLSRMAVHNNREVLSQKHLVIKIIGSIFALWCSFEIVSFVIFLRQIDFPVSMVEPFVGPNTIIRSSDKILIWGQPTYVQKMALSQSIGIFTSLGIAAYCFMFRSSCSKWYGKLGKFFLGIALYALYVSSTDFHYFDFVELIPAGLFLALSLFVIFRKDKTAINDNNITDGITSEIPSSDSVEICSNTNVEAEEKPIDINVSQEEQIENRPKKEVQLKKSNKENKWKPLLFLLVSVLAILLFFVLSHYIPRNDISKPHEDSRIGNFDFVDLSVSKIAEMKYKRQSISESDQDELWQHTILYKLFHCNDDKQSKYYGEQIRLWIYDISSDIHKSDYTELGYYKYLADQIKSSNQLIQNTDSINNGVMISSPTLCKLEFYDDSYNDCTGYFFKIIYILGNERVYRFNFIQDAGTSQYPNLKGKGFGDAIDKRFMSIIDRIDFSSYQQWKDNEERIESVRPYYKAICVLLILLGFLFPLLGVRIILHNVVNDNSKANTICKAICWFIIIVTFIECAVAIVNAIDHNSEEYVEIPLGIMLCHIIGALPLFVLACHYKTKSHVKTEKRTRLTWGKILQKIAIYPFAIIAAMLYSCKEQFMEIFNDYRNRDK